MTQIIKGANVLVPTSRLRVAVGRSAAPGVPGVDASALLLDASGKVRGDADLVFYNQPQHPSGAVRHSGTAQGNGQLAEWLELDLVGIEPAVQRVVLAASCDGGVFGAVPGLFIQALGPDGVVVMHYAVTDATTETAFVLGEFYRRNGMWRFRAVGQGYASGLAGLATDFGITVAEPTAPPAPQPTTPPAPVPYQPQPAPPPAFQVPSAPQAFPPPAAPAAYAHPAPAPYQQPAPPPAPAPFQPLAGHPAPAAYPPQAAPGGYPPPAAYPAYPRPAGPTPYQQQPSPPPAHQQPAQPAPVAPPPDPFGTLPSFHPFTRRGHGTVTVSVDVPLPPGPALIEAWRQGDGYFSVKSLSHRHEPEDRYFSTGLTDFRGRAITRIPTQGQLRLRVEADGNWTVVIHPLSAIRRLDRLAVQGRGDEVFAYTGPPAELDVSFRGDRYDHDDITITTRALFGPEDSFDHPEPLLRDAVGPFRQTVPLFEGPLFLTVQSEGQWSLHIRPPRT
ncbi:TerD family protein [Streptomyces albipurpureus]|uniref:TerD family protein n=1 Tax=Streptomyces albipurpureus TaxID=2897419 RepID=A0ABT0URM3_9ACTN|nr:TerD family protein [Streptomyces sp. CWNU-1]MCM2391264.1 TerD family protein [Streptomyces sp. CWNU-1]